MKSLPLLLPVGLPSLRAFAGDSDRSSKDPAIYVSAMDSSEVHGLVYVSELRDGVTELRNGTRTDSSINSNMILTAGSNSAGSGGVYVQGNDINRSRTAEGKLTSLGPFGAMYASNNFDHNILTYSDSGVCGDSGVWGSLSTMSR
jgi:hypothetical protein